MLLTLVLGSSLTATAQEEPAPVKSYMVATHPDWEVTPLLSVGDTVPLATDRSKQFQMLGIPDGLGRTGVRNGKFTLWMNHELRYDVLTEHIIGAPNNRGSLVSEFKISTAGEILSGRRAYVSSFLENEYIGPAAQEDNETPAFGRFCSMTVVGKSHGFDRRIVFTNEETDTPDVQDTFDPLGGSTVAIFGRAAYALPDFGHHAKENTVFMKGTGDRTVALSLEDGPVTPDSQLYMYVGTKKPKSLSPLTRNGLDNGTLYVFAPVDPATPTENEFGVTQGTLEGTWVEVPNAGAMTDVELEEASDALGAFGFIRIEDGDFSKTHPGDFFFVTTGAPNTGNRLGRVYRLEMDPADPLAGADLDLVIDGATVVEGGQDTVLSGDNLVVTEDHLTIQEGGTGATRPVLAELGRELSIWMFPLGGKGAHTTVKTPLGQRLAEVYPPGRDGIVVPLGSWESSGIIDGEPIFGSPSWIGTVQAHPPTTAPGINTFQDGQLLVLHPKA